MATTVERSVERSWALRDRAEGVIPLATQTHSKAAREALRGVEPCYLVRGEGVPGVGPGRERVHRFPKWTGTDFAGVPVSGGGRGGAPTDGAGDDFQLSPSAGSGGGRASGGGDSLRGTRPVFEDRRRGDGGDAPAGPGVYRAGSDSDQRVPRLGEYDVSHRGAGRDPADLPGIALGGCGALCGGVRDCS